MNAKHSLRALPGPVRRGCLSFGALERRRGRDLADPGRSRSATRNLPVAAPAKVPTDRF